jgi:kinetochore protein NDC80
MNHDREQLTRTLDDLRRKIAEASQNAYSQEVAVTRSMDRFEQLISDYTTLCQQIGVIRPISEGPLGPDGIDYNIELELGLEDLNELQSSGSKLRADIEPALKRFAQDLRAQLSSIRDEIIDLVQANEQVTQQIELKNNDKRNQEIKLSTEVEKADEMKKVSDGSVRVALRNTLALARLE